MVHLYPYVGMFVFSQPGPGDILPYVHSLARHWTNLLLLLTHYAWVGLKTYILDLLRMLI